MHTGRSVPCTPSATAAMSLVLNASNFRARGRQAIRSPPSPSFPSMPPLPLRLRLDNRILSLDAIVRMPGRRTRFSRSAARMHCRLALLPVVRMAGLGWSDRPVATARVHFQLALLSVVRMAGLGCSSRPVAIVRMALGATLRIASAPSSTSRASYLLLIAVDCWCGQIRYCAGNHLGCVGELRVKNKRVLECCPRCVCSVRGVV